MKIKLHFYVDLGIGEQHTKLKTWFEKLSFEAAFQDAMKTLFPTVDSLLKVKLVVFVQRKDYVCS